MLKVFGHDRLKLFNSRLQKVLFHYLFTQTQLKYNTNHRKYRRIWYIHMQKKYRDWFTPFTWYTIKFIWLLVKNVLYIINRLQRVINWYIHMRTCCGKISCFRVSVFWFEARGWSPYWLCLVRTGGHLCRSLQASSTSLSNIHLILFPRELPNGTGNNEKAFKRFDLWCCGG